MSLPIVSLANRKLQFNDILLMDILDIAKLNQNHYEAQLTSLLYRIIGDADMVAILSVQERYAIFLKYLDTVKHHNLDSSINISDYLSENLNDFNLDRLSNEKGVSVRQLMGIEAEALEIGCEGTEDWILGEMAITIGCNYLPSIDTVDDGNVLSIEYIGKMLESRIETLRKLSQKEFNELMSQFLELRRELKKLVKFHFEDGIVLEKINGGTDDAPVRFRPRTAFYGYSKELLSIAIGEYSTIQS